MPISLIEYVFNYSGVLSLMAYVLAGNEFFSVHEYNCAYAF